MNYADYRASEIQKHTELIRYWLVEDLHHRGENRFGLEFKHDQRFRETGNFYIETAEKAEPREGDYFPSGIFRDDNSWLWAQGDQNELWVFFKHTLLALNSDPNLKRRQTPTSRGYLLPLPRAERHVLRVLPRHTAQTPGRQDGDKNLEEALLNPFHAERIRASVDGEWVA